MGKMKKRNKNLISITLSIALAASSLTGCGSSALGDGPTAVLKNPAEADTNSEDSVDGSYVGPETDTVQWFNASYAILTALNNNDYNTFGMQEINEVNKAINQATLDQSWGVTDRASADETLEWILTEGHRAYFMEDIELFNEAGLGDVPAEEIVDFLMKTYEYTEEEAEYVASVYQMYEEYGEHAVDGWDYCRALSLMGFYYAAGYYTKEEALDKSLEIAKELQPLYSSWDELVDSYLRGYEYWAQTDSSERRAVYEELLAAEDNPFRVDYNITLEKTW